jgi:hypothetical protein
MRVSLGLGLLCLAVSAHAGTGSVLDRITAGARPAHRHGGLKRLKLDVGTLATEAQEVPEPADELALPSGFLPLLSGPGDVPSLLAALLAASAERANAAWRSAPAAADWQRARTAIAAKDAPALKSLASQARARGAACDKLVAGYAELALARVSGRKPAQWRRFLAEISSDDGRLARALVDLNHELGVETKAQERLRLALAGFERQLPRLMAAEPQKVAEVARAELAAAADEQVAEAALYRSANQAMRARVQEELEKRVPEVARLLAHRADLEALLRKKLAPAIADADAAATKLGEVISRRAAEAAASGGLAADTASAAEAARAKKAEVARALAELASDGRMLADGLAQKLPGYQPVLGAVILPSVFQEFADISAAASAASVQAKWQEMVAEPLRGLATEVADQMAADLAAVEERVDEELADQMDAADARASIP